MGHIADILKYEGDNTTFVWKHPCEDFNNYTQLIVHETQEAVLFLNGQALDLFGPGRHTLETQNTPLLSGLLNRTTNGETPFHCEVYFINKTEQMAIRWGTDSQAQFLEPTYHFPLSLGASGEMSLRVLDARRLLLRLVGTAPVLDQQTLAAYFRAFLMARVKTYIAQFMQANTVSIFELDAHMLDFSQALQQQLAPDFADYGVELVRFFVTNLARPDGEAQYEKFKELHFRKYADIAEAQLRQQTDLIQAQTEAQKTLIASQAIAQKRVQEGYTYQQERSFDVAQDAAKNAGAGGLTGLGIGIGASAVLSETRSVMHCAARCSRRRQPFSAKTAAQGFHRVQHSAITADALYRATKKLARNVAIGLHETENSARNAARRGRTKRCGQKSGWLSFWYF